ncbi:MAG TPA: 3-hydroxyacyl-CoA dehydrogenase family protein [Acidothermaceae bacterium]|nr:3-hydroxyacyl-CoA dehydrogenase family protein [Acidothermaceae bacterium]
MQGDGVPHRILGNGVKLRAAVIGGGLMGQGIASVLSAGGCDVRVFDSDPNVLRTADTIRAAAADTDWVIESIAEALHPKLAVLAEIERHAPADAVISSNTSTFMPSTLNTALAKPERFLNTHFFRPADAVPLVEVIPSRATEPSVASRVHSWLTELGKRPITLGQEMPGFVANRLQAAILREAIHLLDSGVASVEEIDAVVEHSIGKRWSVAGPFMIADLGGLDVFRAVCANVFPSLSNTPDVPETLDRMVNEGRLGAKSGDGFYRDPSEWTAAADRINVQFRR